MLAHLMQYHIVKFAIVAICLYKTCHSYSVHNYSYTIFATFNWKVYSNNLLLPKKLQFSPITFYKVEEYRASAGWVRKWRTEQRKSQQKSQRQACNTTYAHRAHRKKLMTIKVHHAALRLVTFYIQSTVHFEDLMQDHSLVEALHREFHAIQESLEFNQEQVTALRKENKTLLYYVLANSRHNSQQWRKETNKNERNHTGFTDTQHEGQYSTV